MPAWTDEVHATLEGIGRSAEGDATLPTGRVRFGFSHALGGAPDANTSTPEHLLASAAVSCWLLTFADAAQRLRLDVVRATATARVHVVPDGPGWRVGSIEVRPEIVVRGEREALEAKVSRACDIAGRYCIVEKALRPGVGDYEVTPTIAYEP